MKKNFRIVLLMTIAASLIFVLFSSAQAGTISASDAIASLKTWEGTTGYGGWCLKWVHDAWLRTGAFDGNYSVTHESAQQYWDNLVQAGRAHSSPGNPSDIPLCADVFFSSPNGAGHIGIYLGDGKFISADDQVAIYPFWNEPTVYGDYWAKAYYGWAWHDGVAVDQEDRSGIPIDAEHFPDANFREAISQNFDSNSNGYLSDSEIENAKDLRVTSKNITSLAGVEYLTNLEYLQCNDNELNTLDVSHNINLTGLRCGRCNLSELDVSQNTKLKLLTCYYNKLTELDISHNTLLTYLQCRGNQLSSLELSNNPYLECLECSENLILWLDITENPHLIKAYENGLTDVGENATGLSVDDTTFVITAHQPDVFVNRCCNLLYGRNFLSEDEWNTEIEKLASGAMTGMDIIWKMTSSQEFENRNLNSHDTVSLLTQTMYDRFASPSELTEAVTYLNENSLKKLLQKMAVSSEYKFLCARYGVLPGTLDDDPIPYQFALALYSGASVREGAAKEYRVIDRVYKGTILGIIGYEPSWYHVTFRSQNLESSVTGYISEEMIQLLTDGEIQSHMLSLPTSLTVIEDSAFENLNNVYAVKIPTSVLSISTSSFSGDSIIIYAPSGSYAIKWAKDHGYLFVEINK